jgi:endonuclease/exonuclease/phosphatase family metal-dependent hydrolase
MRYSLLNDLIEKKTERRRAVKNLERLRAQLETEVPEKDVEDNLLLATWNIRDLNKVNRRGVGERLPETYFYIAEVLSRFDFVAVQEVNELNEWKKITKILGPAWDWVATDVTDPGLGGNGERLTFLYDRRKVSFRHIAGELVLPSNLMIGKQFRRTPFTALFQAGWFKFEICTVHIYYGSGGGAKFKERVEEIKTIASYLGKRAKKSAADERALILLGDFNIVDRKNETMDALVKKGFRVPQALQEVGATNVDKNKYYDQIAVHKLAGIDDLDKAAPDGLPRAGTVPIFENVFTGDQFTQYKAAAASSDKGKPKQGEKLKAYYEEWRTYQFSDHFPLWVRVPVNKSGEFLQKLD